MSEEENGGPRARGWNQILSGRFGKTSECVSVFACMSVFQSPWVCVCVWVCLYVSNTVCTCVCASFLCVSLSKRMFVCVHVCVCMHACVPVFLRVMHAGVVADPDICGHCDLRE